jgi:hypothetical protein
MLQELRDHVIIAGYGRAGQLIGQLLSENLIPFVALDVSNERVAAGKVWCVALYAYCGLLNNTYCTVCGTGRVQQACGGRQSALPSWTRPPHSMYLKWQHWNFQPPDQYMSVHKCGPMSCGQSG